MIILSNVKSENLLYCGQCEKVLTKDMEVEYSREIGEYFCSPDCATTRYYDYMSSSPLESDVFDEYDIKILPDGRLFKKV